MSQKYSLVLGSQSPRRKELLGLLKIPYEIVVLPTTEEVPEGDPVKFVEHVASRKCDVIWAQLKKRPNFSTVYFPLLITADTIVVLQGKILGKPDDREDARRILSQLSGNEHSVYTSVMLQTLDMENKKIRQRCFTVQSRVVFSEISRSIMDHYLDTGESLDKAGAYGIQGPSLTFVKEVYGSYANVVGFPLVEFVAELKQFVLADDQTLWSKFHGG